jgi:hypothetical protein
MFAYESNRATRGSHISCIGDPAAMFADCTRPARPQRNAVRTTVRYAVGRPLCRKRHSLKPPGPVVNRNLSAADRAARRRGILGPELALVYGSRSRRYCDWDVVSLAQVLPARGRTTLLGQCVEGRRPRRS